jgi:hypothetical protein
MKKLFTVACLALLFTSCEKELSNSDSNILALDNTENAVYQINASGEFELIQISEDMLEQTKTGSISTRSNGNSAHTHGDFSWEAAGITLEWSGTENNGGPHGSATFQQVMNLPFPPFSANLQLTLETECVTVIDNEAVYGGLITEAVDNPFPPGGPFDVGNHVFFKVIDNGQGNNAPADQYATGIFIVPSFVTTACDIFTPDAPYWGSTLDVVSPGKVKVN